MCGIVVCASLSDSPNQKKVFKNVHEALAHRGPHGSGTWFSDNSPKSQHFALGHHRLAIVDLSEKANQPLIGQKGSRIIVNGEIYNADKLRNELKASYKFQTHSDSEVLLAVLDIFGIHGLSKIDGMFAFAYVPSDQSSLWVGRDRLGIKPLYWAREGDAFWFASEAQPLARALNRKLDNHGFTEWARYQFQTSDRTFFEGVQSVPAGHILTVKDGQLKMRKYWSLDDHLPSGNVTQISNSDAQNRLAELIESSVKDHLMSDVEIATITSGGMDSSWISAIAAQNGVSKAFVGRYMEDGHDESKYARRVADHCGLDLEVIDISAEDYFFGLRELGKVGDYPVAGPGAVGQLIVARRISESHRVVLAGTGGDELFLGYVRDRLPLIAMSLLNAATGSDSSAWAEISGDINGLVGYGPMLKKFSDASGFSNPLSGFLAIVQRTNSKNGIFRLNQDVVDDVDSELRAFIAPNGVENLFELHDALIRYEVGKFLPSLLHVEDRVTMAYGLESRVPIIGLELLEFLLKLPLEVRLGGSKPKDLIRGVASELLPTEVLDRKDKMGFPVPLNNWARGAGKKEILRTLQSLSDRELDFINPSTLSEVLKSQDFAGRQLWAALTLENWLSVNS